MFSQQPTTHPGLHNLPVQAEAGCTPAKPADADEQDRLDMARLASGHGAALNDLMERYAERIFHYLVRSLQNEEDAADLAQETFVRIYQNRTKFDADKRFSTWLYAIARNVATDHLRRNHCTLLDIDEVTTQAEGELESDVERKDNLRRLAALLAALPPREAELIALKYGAGLTNRSIAQLTGLSEANVGTILHRVVRRLREAWGDQNER